MRFAMRNKNWRMGSVNTENKVKFEVASCKEIGDSRGVYLETRASEPWHFQRILFYFYYTLLDLIIPDYEMFKTWEENFSIDFNWNCKNPFDRISVFSFFLFFFSISPSDINSRDIACNYFTLLNFDMSTLNGVSV